MRRSVARLVVALLGISAASPWSIARAQAGAAPAAVLPAPAAVDSLRAELARVLASRDLRFARFGFQLLEVGAQGKPNRVLLEHDADRGYMTASNMKLIASAVALDVLGPEFVYTTRLVGRGKQLGAAFAGDLVLVGAGDPTFGARAFEPNGATAPFARMAKALRARGIEYVTGCVIGDDDVHPDEIMGLGWDWSYHADWYAAQVSGLCFNENCIDLIFGGTRVGAPPTCKLDPETAYIELVNHVRCVDRASGDVVFSRGLGTNRIVVSGTLPVQTKAKRDWGSVHNPTLFAATVLREELMRRGVRVDGPAVDGDQLAGGSAATAQVVFYEHRSPSMRKILESLNKRSQNLYAEQVLRTAGRKLGGDGSMRSGAAAVRRVFAKFGIDTDGLVIADGSGLSRLNLVQPRQLTALLAAFVHHEHAKLFLATLPVAGIDGTLRGRFPPGAPAHGRVLAKTGYIGRVVALSGYVPRRGDTPLAFSVLVNDFHAPTARIKKLVDQLVNRIAALAGPN